MQNLYDSPCLGTMLEVIAVPDISIAGMYVYICIYVCMCVYIYMYMYISVCVCVYVFVCLYMYEYICTFASVLVHVNASAFTIVQSIYPYELQTRLLNQLSLPYPPTDLSPAW